MKETRSAGCQHSRAIAAALFFWCLFVGYLAGLNLYSAQLYARLWSQVQIIEKGSSIENTLRGKHYFEEILNDARCRGPLVKAALTLSLADSDQAALGRDQMVTLEFMKYSHAMVSQALKCQPTNGNFWLRLAMLRYKINAFNPSVVEFLRRSLKYSASERDVISGRLMLVGVMNSSDLNKVMIVADHDIRVYCYYRNTDFWKEIDSVMAEYVLPLGRSGYGCSM